jgi:undecaprenyl phosphate N,N'-diacetylbacillosamine 1-phosphate transferase
MFYSRYGKRILDLCFIIPAGIILLPFLACIALIIKIESAGPVFFIQERLGQNKKIFDAFKFRTMTAKPRTQHQDIVGHNPEVTQVGYWLRRFKLDEVPQFYNVLKGDMSLVGPRPPLPDQLHQYDDKVAKRLSVKPGLTGLAQTHGNIFLTWPERWQYDIQYVNQLCLKLDLLILFRTIAVVFSGEQKFHKPLDNE